MQKVKIVGGGLAGSEAAWQLAQRGISVDLYEMRPMCETGAHQTADLAELVCSNSLGSKLPDRAPGLLKDEIKTMGSLLLHIAYENALPAGGALAVDRDGFSRQVTRKLETHKNINIIRQEVKEIPDGPTIISSGPLTSIALSNAINALAGSNRLYFYDAIAPIVTAESINMDIAFRASRYGRSEQADGDYINCPFTREEYEAFYTSLLKAETVALRSFEEEIRDGVQAGSAKYFEGCLPIEVIASRGPRTLAFGPMRPVGLTNPNTDRRPYAVVQLRQDNLAGSLYNLVGFQTNLTFKEQDKVFRMIPGLEQAEFIRHGQMHRNTFIASPELLYPSMQFRSREDLFFAGQITGIEGYVGSIATGLLAGINMAHYLRGNPLHTLPHETMLGALTHYITHTPIDDFQPMKANFGLLPEPDKKIKGKRARGQHRAERAMKALQQFLEQNDIHL